MKIRMKVWYATVFVLTLGVGIFGSDSVPEGYKSDPDVLRKAKENLEDAKRQLAIATARNAPPVDMSDGFMPRSVKPPILNGGEIAEKIKKAYHGQYLKEWEAQAIASEFARVTRMDVLPDEEYTSKNTASQKEAGIFKQKVLDILQNDTVGRSREAAEYVRDLIVK
ncbi:MAG: hypothetical protein PHX61_07325 [Alphaproteobacteria bacterium]|nr:hypothetical protein [Alphaproteobacteria bacterium]